VADYRPWHLPACPARDAAAAAGSEVGDACECPAEQFIGEFAAPVWEPGDGPLPARERLDRMARQGQADGIYEATDGPPPRTR
jgi:hypothetical protein